MTIRQTADVLGLKVRTIRKWVALGYLSAEKNGKMWQIPEEEVMGKEIQIRADNSRKHSERIKAGKELGVLAGRSKNSKKSI